MSNTPHLGLPFLEAAQAQKHVTVNDSLRALDALVQLSVKDANLTVPPGSPVEGDRHIVAASATGAWAGKDNQIAAWQDSAWAFFVPVIGWLAWEESGERWLVYDGAAWQAGPRSSLGARSANGAATRLAIVEEEHTLAAASTSDTTMTIPDRAVVIGVTGLVTQAITGATSWDLGVVAATNRYGNTIGVTLGSTLNGVSGTPTAYYAATSLRLTANGAAFTGGKVRLAIHYLLLDVPVS